MLLSPEPSLQPFTTKLLFITLFLFLIWHVSIFLAYFPLCSQGSLYNCLKSFIRYPIFVCWNRTPQTGQFIVYRRYQKAKTIEDLFAVWSFKGRSSPVRADATVTSVIHSCRPSPLCLLKVPPLNALGMLVKFHEFRGAFQPEESCITSTVTFLRSSSDSSVYSSWTVLLVSLEKPHRDFLIFVVVVVVLKGLTAVVVHLGPRTFFLLLAWGVRGSPLHPASVVDCLEAVSGDRV